MESDDYTTPPPPDNELEKHAKDLTEDLLASRDFVACYAIHRDSARKQPVVGHFAPMVARRLRQIDALIDRVFTTYELLEMILLLLPQRDLLLASGVSKAFQNIISRSQAIQHALCMRVGTVQATDDDCEPEWNMLICDNSLQVGPWIHHDSWPSVPGPLDAVKLEISYMLDDDHFSRAPFLPSADSTESLYMNAGSWEKMYLTRNTYQSVAVTLHHQGDATPSTRYVFDNGQVTMGELQEVMRVVLNSTIASNLWREYIDHGVACPCPSCKAAALALAEETEEARMRKERDAKEALYAAEESEEDSQDDSQEESEEDDAEEDEE
ncbi:hypothetical protein LTR56_015796 [Elasticomyces elasticus]|nr:hypothetical protein LTR56_015796 [Elasticomyces elasticus]KAK3644080.1 hypothetical protein LTR22_015402 [Elasticomyces elasticus]KAK4922004.1 hypothetical protein LTR49_010589 [Elasticomyces elasticus]KAK5768815.1 hypothetical protein LTS12_000875 [Elasticomyces elasticus]